ncbi:MAG: response regulator transcription factor [Bdellovibrionales bacterium]|nr:response regulator transcription factor [Bdellovibrionales bacterium]
MHQVVLVDDDPMIHTLVKGVLEKDVDFRGYFSLEEVRLALDGIRAPNLLLIDRLLPDGDGLYLCQEVKTNPSLSHVPIVFLSGKESEVDRVGGLYAGAEDYICKSVGPLELKARIQTRLRSLERKISRGSLSVDLTTHRVYKFDHNQSREIDLTRIELKILIKLLKSPDQVHSRDSIINHAWGMNTHVNDRAVDTHISHLRKKIQGTGVTIESLRGEGYRIQGLSKKAG